jgi:hypothetical protein
LRRAKGNSIPIRTLNVAGEAVNPLRYARTRTLAAEFERNHFARLRLAVAQKLYAMTEIRIKRIL